jgi:hypothetical protein
MAESSTIYFRREGSDSSRCPCVLHCGYNAVTRPQDNDIPRLQEPFRHVFWATAHAAAFGTTYSEMQVWQRGGQAIDVYGMARGAITGALIGAS